MTYEPAPASGRSPRFIPFAIYIAYLASFLTGISLFVGVVMAYVQRGTGPDWLESHFRYQIRTFWIFFIYFLIGLALTLVLVGFVILFFASVWFIVRCVKGMSLLDRGAPIPDPKTWLW